MRSGPCVDLCAEARCAALLCAPFLMDRFSFVFRFCFLFFHVHAFAPSLVPPPFLGHSFRWRFTGDWGVLGLRPSVLVAFSVPLRECFFLYCLCAAQGTPTFVLKSGPCSVVDSILRAAFYLAVLMVERQSRTYSFSHYSGHSCI